MSGLKAIVGGNILDPAGDRYIERGTILIDGKRITAIGSSQQLGVPDGAQVISAEGACVIPGLIDSHNHLYLDGSFQAQSLDPDAAILKRAIRNARKQLRDGVTTVRECGTPRYIDLQLKDLIEENLIPGPHLVCAGQWITATNGHGGFPSAACIADGPEEVRKAVRTVLLHGADFVKVMVTGGTATPWVSPVQAYYSPDELRAVVEEAHRHGKQVSAHIHGGPGVQMAVEAGIDTLEHGAFIDDPEVVDLIASAGVAWMFNQGARMGEPTRSYPAFQWERMLTAREKSILAFQAARAAGVKIMSGCDGEHDNHASVTNLEALVSCGASPREALLAATRTPAEVMGIAPDRGTLEPGRFADLLIVNGDPLENVSALRDLRLVMKQGTVYQDL